MNESEVKGLKWNLKKVRRLVLHFSPFFIEQILTNLLLDCIFFLYPPYLQNINKIKDQ